MSLARLDHPARTRLEAGEVSIGIGVRNARVVDIAPIMKAAGIDWLFLDFEHVALTADIAAQIAITANAVGISPIARIPLGELDLASRLLDNGVMGIVVPHVETVEEAKSVVDRLRFAPMGHRGVSATMPQFGFHTTDLVAGTRELNRANLLAVMLETPEAIEKADEIAAIPGIDIVMIGTNDLAMAFDRPGQFDCPEVVGAYTKVARACRQHGKWLGSGGLNTQGQFEHYIKAGARFILAGSDTGFLINGARARQEMLRAIKT